MYNFHAQNFRASKKLLKDICVKCKENDRCLEEHEEK